MRAAVYHGKEDVRIEDVTDPQAPGQGEVLLKVIRGAICGTDVSEYLHGPLMIPLNHVHPASGHCGPTILGHEFVGRIVALGTGVSGLSVGSRVVPGAGMWCGQCRWCAEGRPNLCANYFVFGLHTHGGLATLARIPAKMCYEVPDACRDEYAAIAQPCAIALHAARRSGVRPGQTVALLGVGGIGAFILAAVRAMGVESIIALDVDEGRLTIAEQLGATSVVRVSSAENALGAIRCFTSGHGVDLVIEASGAADAPSLAFASVRRGGRVLLVGLQTSPRELDLHEMVVHEVEVIASNGHVCGTDLPEALALLTTTNLGKAILDRVIPLEALVPEGLRALSERRAKGKIVVAP